MHSFQIADGLNLIEYSTNKNWPRFINDTRGLMLTKYCGIRMQPTFSV